ncbi:MAG: glycerol-3-phosphate 1-O-acyltransferase PlsY [Clostridiales bacterium]|nr:glycerol-3-phosphate 1-O-acyltransferase PlsY [Clostridiales bacterium]
MLGNTLISYILAILFVLGAYALGSVSSAYIVTKLFLGQDIRKMGSGNVGSTNALRVVGVKGAIIVLIIDIGKGFLAAWLGTILLNSLFGVIMGTAAVFGHVFPFWLNFKGGKGAATAFGFLLAIWPLAAFIIILAWALIILISRYVSLATIAAAILAVIFGFWSRLDPLAIIVMDIAFLLVLLRHKDNIGRLLRKEESKLGRS